MTRKNIIIVLVGLVLSMTSCNRAFDELAINPSQPSMGKYFTTPEACNSAVCALYGYISTQRCLGASGSKTQIVRSDEVSGNSDYAKPGMYGSSLNSSYYTIEQPFVLMYTTASQASFVIETIETVEFTDISLRNAYQGEAYFWRAFSHYYLLMNYRNIAPIRNMPKNASDYARAQESPSDVWDFIIEDLQKAKELLPAKGYWKSVDNGRVTKASAAALLGMSYLYRTGIEAKYGNDNRAYYSEAAQEFADIIDGKYGAYRLTADYSWNFDVAHEYNDESILEFDFLGDVENNSFNPGLATSGLAFDGRGVMMPGAGVGYENVVHDWLYDTFKASKDLDGNTDPRMAVTMFFDDQVDGITFKSRPTGPGGHLFEEIYPKRNFSTAGNARTHAYKACMKKFIDLTMPMRNGDPTSLAGVGAGTKEYIYNQPRAHGVNWRYIRYANVLLMYAEACLSGGTATCGITPTQAYNEVRKRSNMSEKGAIVLEDVKQERVLELATEGHRYFDLLRWGEVETRFRSLEASDPNFKKLISDTDYEGFTANKHEWLPIPINEIESNKPLAKQNPGY